MGCSENSMKLALFLLAFGWTAAMASSRIAFVMPGGSRTLVTGQPTWRSMLAATLVVAEAAMAVWAVLALPIVWALGVLGAGLGIGMLAVSQGRLAAFFYLKPALDVVALASAAALWGLFIPL